MDDAACGPVADHGRSKAPLRNLGPASTLKDPGDLVVELPRARDLLGIRSRGDVGLHGVQAPPEIQQRPERRPTPERRDLQVLRPLRVAGGDPRCPGDRLGEPTDGQQLPPDLAQLIPGRSLLVQGAHRLHQRRQRGIQGQPAAVLHRGREVRAPGLQHRLGPSYRAPLPPTRRVTRATLLGTGSPRASGPPPGRLIPNRLNSNRLNSGLLKSGLLSSSPRPPEPLDQPDAPTGGRGGGAGAPPKRRQQVDGSTPALAREVRGPLRERELDLRPGDEALPDPQQPLDQLQTLTGRDPGARNPTLGLLDPSRQLDRLGGSQQQPREQRSDHGPLWLSEGQLPRASERAPEDANGL